MDEKKFLKLNKYYTFSKKYFGLILLGLSFVLACVIKNMVALFLIYFGALILHFVFMGICQKILVKDLEKTLDNMSDDDLKDIKNND